jgi:sulfonate transport system permease protein
MREALYKIGLLAAIIASWQLLSGRVLNPFFFSSPLGIYNAAANFIMGVQTPASPPATFKDDLIVTFQETVEGYLLGVLTGVPVGLVLGLNKRLARLLDPFIFAIYSIPKITLAPLFILWFGIGVGSKIALSFVLVFFLVFFNTYAGVVNTPVDLTNLFRVMGATKRQIMTKLTLPAAASYIFVGLRVSLPAALIGAVAGEFIVSNVGLGFYINYEADLFSTDGVFAGILLVSMIALLLDYGLKRLEKRALRWRPQTV